MNMPVAVAQEKSEAPARDQEVAEGSGMLQAAGAASSVNQHFSSEVSDKADDEKPKALDWDESMFVSDAKASSRSKRKAKKRPSDMPRRPLSAYNIFFKTERANMIEQALKKLLDEGRAKHGENFRLPARGPKISFEDMAKTIAKRWRQLSEQEMEKFKDLAAADLRRYQDETETYQKDMARKARLERERAEKEEEAAASRSNNVGPLAVPGFAHLAQSPVQPIVQASVAPSTSSTAVGQNLLDQILTILLGGGIAATLLCQLLTSPAFLTCLQQSLSPGPSAPVPPPPPPPPRTVVQPQVASSQHIPSIETLLAVLVGSGAGNATSQFSSGNGSMVYDKHVQSPPVATATALNSNTNGFGGQPTMGDRSAQDLLQQLLLSLQQGPSNATSNGGTSGLHYNGSSNFSGS